MGHGGQIDEVRIMEKWVHRDLSAGTFSKEEQATVLDDIDKLEEDLVTWNRPITKCLTILTTNSDVTVYRRRTGDCRSYFIRDGPIMYCIGVGKRKTTYKRDLQTKIIERAKDFF